MLTLFIIISCFSLALGGNYYSDSSAQFHPSGRILLTEQAKQVVAEMGGPVVAVKCRDGIILSASRHIRSCSLVEKPQQKIFHVDRHITIGATGYLFQSKLVIEAARRVCSEYRRKYSSPIPVESLCDELTQEYHKMTLEGKHQPIGVALVVCGWDDDLGPQIFTVDPEGSSKGWNAVAIGANSNALMEELSAMLPEEQSSPGSTSKVKSFGSVARLWPSFKRRVLQKYFGNKEDSTQMLQVGGSSDALDWSNSGLSGDAEWATEVKYLIVILAEYSPIYYRNILNCLHPSHIL